MVTFSFEGFIRLSKVRTCQAKSSEVKILIWKIGTVFSIVSALMYVFSMVIKYVKLYVSELI